MTEVRDPELALDAEPVPVRMSETLRKQARGPGAAVLPDGDLDHVPVSSLLTRRLFLRCAMPSTPTWILRSTWAAAQTSFVAEIEP
jgi:hypothetical protein